MKKQTIKESNLKKILIKEQDYYLKISAYPIKDKRLSMAEKGFYISLLDLPNNWRITTKATSDYLNISEKSFITYLKTLKLYGYIEIEKIGKEYNYILKDKPTNHTFNVKDIDSFTLKELNYYLNNDLTPTKYKNLIKKKLNELINIVIESNKIIDDLEKTKSINNINKIEINKENNDEEDSINNNDDGFLPFD